METQPKHTGLHRILHWIAAFAMTVLFSTGFLRMYWMNRRSIIEIIQSKISDISIPKEHMRSIVQAIQEPMWQWHGIFAHVMIFTMLARIIYMIAKGIRFPKPFASGISWKERLQGLTYVYFYIFVTMSIFTGICIEKGFFESAHETIESVHKWGIFWFPIFIFLHLSGIILAEFSDKKGIVSKMISGD